MAERIEEKAESCLTPMLALKKEETKLFHIYYIYLLINRKEKLSNVKDESTSMKTFEPTCIYKMS